MNQTVKEERETQSEADVEDVRADGVGDGVVIITLQGILVGDDRLSSQALCQIREVPSSAGVACVDTTSHLLEKRLENTQATKLAADCV